MTTNFLLNSIPLERRKPVLNFKDKYIDTSDQLSSTQLVVSDSLRSHGLQHARLPYPSPYPELAQSHVHRVRDAIQPSHPLSSSSTPPFNLSQHQDLFQ